LRTETTVSSKIWLLVALCLGFSGTAIGVLMYQLKATSTTYESTLKTLQDRVRQQDAARVVQVTFKKQVQEWKDILHNSARRQPKSASWARLSKPR
jgi:hypothetical protein